MFEVGRSYRITSWSQHEGESYTSATVLEVDLPLLKVSKVGNYKILNTASPAFVSATPDDEKAAADEAVALEEWRANFQVRTTRDDDERPDDAEPSGPVTGY